MKKNLLKYLRFLHNKQLDHFQTWIFQETFLLTCARAARFATESAPYVISPAVPFLPPSAAAICPNVVSAGLGER